MPLPAEALALADAQRVRQQTLAARLTQAAGARWQLLDRSNLAGSWSQLAPGVLTLTTVALAEAGRGSQQYVAAAMTAQGATPDPAGSVTVAPLAGAASDGRPLNTLLDVPLLDALGFIADGMDVETALARGGTALTRILGTQVQDFARVPVGVAQVNDRAVRCWVRVTNPPSCSRCVILAGRVSHVQKAFHRHENCDCTNMPSAELVEPLSPRALFDRMSAADLRYAGWSEADIRAIRDEGADIYQVTNAHRRLSSMTVAGRPVQTTTVAASRRGLAGSRLGAPRGGQAIRLTPESIYAEAERLGWSREQLIDQLRRHGYIL